MKRCWLARRIFQIYQVFRLGRIAGIRYRVEPVSSARRRLLASVAPLFRTFRSRILLVCRRQRDQRNLLTVCTNPLLLYPYLLRLHPMQSRIHRMSFFTRRNHHPTRFHLCCKYHRRINNDSLIRRRLDVVSSTIARGIGEEIIIVGMKEKLWW